MNQGFLANVPHHRATILTIGSLVSFEVEKPP